MSYNLKRRLPRNHDELGQFHRMAQRKFDEEKKVEDLEFWLGLVERNGEAGRVLGLRSQ